MIDDRGGRRGTACCARRSIDVVDVSDGGDALRSTSSTTPALVIVGSSVQQAPRSSEELTTAALTDGGIALFDEIGDMSLCAQAKILCLVESRESEQRSIPADVRVIATAHPGLDHLMSAGRLRKNLCLRLNVVTIHLAGL